MNIRPYIAPLFKWWWLIALAAILAGLTSYFVTRPMPPIFAARTMLIVGRAISDPNPTGNEFTLSRQLAEAYAGLTILEPIREATKVALDLEDLPEYTAQTVPNSPMILIQVTDTNPLIAQSVANELANQLMLQSPTNPERQEQERINFLYQQLDKLQSEITTTQQEIEDKQETLADLTSAAQINDLQNQILALQTKLGLLQTNYATLLENTQRGAINTLSVLERAVLPTHPVGPNKILIILIAVAAGVGLATGAAYLIEFLDRSVKTPEEVSQILEVPVLAYIPTMEHAEGRYDYVAKNPRSPVAEAFRALRTDLDFIGIDKPLKKILVISTGPSDGKTTIASNLAISFAHSEKQVSLLETDLRRPNFSTSLGLKEKPGLSDALRDHLDAQKVTQNWCEPSCVEAITAGSIPPNPAELLGSNRMEIFLENLSENVDVIVIDSPPVIVTDAVILASKADGVLVVVRPGVTNRDDLHALQEQMQRAGAQLVGVIFNRVSVANSYYGGRRVYSKYYGHDGKKAKNSASNTTETEE